MLQLLYLQEKELAVSIKWKTGQGQATGLVWMWWRRENFLSVLGIALQSLILHLLMIVSCWALLLLGFWPFVR
jgi:hypothetical protein